MSCGVGHGCGWDAMLLWLWCRPAAIAPIEPLAWEPPYAVGIALKRERERERERMYCSRGRKIWSHLLMNWLKKPAVMLLEGKGNSN